MADATSALPPAGVSQPTTSGNYIPVGRRGSKLDQARQVVAEADEAQGIQHDAQGGFVEGGFSPSNQPPPRDRRALPKPTQQRQMPVAVPLENRRRGASSPTAEVPSIDGIDYVFPKDAAGSKNPQDIMADILRGCIVALAEVAKGGNPNTVLEAFRVRIADMNGQVFYDYKDARHWIAAGVEGAPPPEEEEEYYEGPDMSDIFAEE